MSNRCKRAHSCTVSWPAHIAPSGLERRETRYTVTSLHQQYSSSPPKSEQQIHFTKNCRNKDTQKRNYSNKKKKDPESINDKRGCEERAAIASPAAAAHTDMMRGTEYTPQSDANTIRSAGGQGLYLSSLSMTVLRGSFLCFKLREGFTPARVSTQTATAPHGSV